MATTGQNTIIAAADGNETASSESTQIEIEEEEEVVVESLPQAELGPRVRRRPAWHDEYEMGNFYEQFSLSIDGIDPSSYEEAKQ